MNFLTTMFSAYEEYLVPLNMIKHEDDLLVLCFQGRWRPRPAAGLN